MYAIGLVNAGIARMQGKSGRTWIWKSWIDERIWWEENRGNASIGKQGTGHGLAICPIALMAQSCLRKNCRITYALDMD